MFQICRIIPQKVPLEVSYPMQQRRGLIEDINSMTFELLKLTDA